MFKNDYNQLDDSIPLSIHAIPLFHSEYIRNVLDAYRREQSQHSTILLKKRVSQKMHHLQQFYLTLPEGILNEDHFFQFLKILFSRDLKECDVTISTVNQVLITHMDSRVVAALDTGVNRIGNFDDLRSFIKAIFHYPEAAASIVMMVLILSDFVRSINKLGKSKDLFVDDILSDIHRNPNSAITFDATVKILRSYTLKQRGVAIYNLQQQSSLSKMLMEDVYIYIFYKLYQQNNLNEETIQKIESLKLKDLEELGLKLRFEPMMTSVAD